MVVVLSEWINKSALSRKDVLESNEEAEHIDTAVNKSLLSSLKDPKTMPTGKIVAVIRRQDKTYCGSIDTNYITYDGVSKVVFIPYDTRLSNIYTFTKRPLQLTDKRIIVKIDKWQPDEKYPMGHIMRVIGIKGEVKVESEVILLEHNVEIKPFSQQVLDCLPKNDYSISEHETIGRKDLRKVVVCSIDPPGCKDIDDALHCSILPNGNYEVGIHIADVSHYVKPNTAIDKEAAKRCTTVYLVEKRTDMLPSLLTENLCSLVCNQDRLAFSIICEFDKKSLDIVKTEYAKTVIRSVASLTYGKAQEIIANTKNNTELAISLRNMLMISKNLRQRRINNGALTLASTEVKFTMDAETHSPIDVALYQQNETNYLVEEFMLLGNVKVAEKIYKHFPTYSILRRHPPPKTKEIQELKETMIKCGFDMKVDSSKELADSLDRMEAPKNPLFNKVVRILTTRTMNQATYFCTAEFNKEDYFHYGLACPLYTHYTSPIRRYSDILAHRLLAAAIDVESLDDSMADKGRVAKQCMQMNMKHKMAQFAGRTSSAFHQYILFKDKEEIQEGTIISVNKRGIQVFIEKIGIEGVIDINEKWKLDEGHQTINVNGKIFKGFDRVKMKIKGVEKKNRFTIDLQLLNE